MNNPNDPTQNALSVQTISIKDGVATAPKRRMSTPAAAWNAYTNLWYQGRKRDARFAQIAGIDTGFPPTPPQVLANNGTPDWPNINLKQFNARLRKYASTWNAISGQNDGWFKVKMKHDDPMEAMRRSECATKYFNNAIRQWDDSAVDEEDFCTLSAYVLNSQVRDMQMGLFGVGVGLWEDEIDFRWTPIPTRRVLMPQGTRLTLANCPAVFIEDNNFSVAQLWSMRGKDGWNDSAIERCLFDRVELQAQTSQRNWSYSEWVNYIRNNDVPYVYDFAPIKVVHAFTQEFDMTISHSIFCDFTYTSGTTNKDFKRSAQSKAYRDASQEFLFDKPKVAKRWQQCLSLFADNAGTEGDFHGVKSFGDMIYDGCDLNNLLFNRGAGGAFLTNTLMFEGATESDIQKMDQIVLTHMGIMTPGLNLTQMKFQGDIEGAMSMFNAGTAILDQNTRDYPQGQRTQGGDQPTATQVNRDAADEAQFDSLQVQNYHTFEDALGAEMYRRLAQPASKYPENWGGGKVAKCFREACEKDGIPVEDLLKVESVKANRTGGTGNVALDNAKADQALSVATPGKGQQNARKAKIAAWWGYENVGAFIEDAPEPTADDANIDSDNLFIQEGQVPQAWPWNDQQKHLTSHLQLLGQAAQAAEQLMAQGTVEQNLDGANKLVNLLVSGAQHAGQHVQLMQQLPRVGKNKGMYESIVAEATKQLNNINQIAAALGEDINKASQNDPQKQSLEMVKAQAQIQIEDAKAKAEIAREDAKAKSKLGHMAIANEAKTQMKLQDHAQQLDAKQVQAQQEMGLKTAETLQEMSQTAAEHHQELRHTEEKAAAEPKPKTK